MGRSEVNMNLTKYQRALLLRGNALEAEKALRHDAEEVFRAIDRGEGTVSVLDALAMIDDAQMAAHEADEYGKLAEQYKQEGT